MTLTHVVLLKWKPGTPDRAVEPGLKKLSKVPLTETYILSYRIGKDLDIGRTHMNHDTAVVAEASSPDSVATAAITEDARAAADLVDLEADQSVAVTLAASRRLRTAR